MKYDYLQQDYTLNIIIKQKYKLYFNNIIYICHLLCIALVTKDTGEVECMGGCLSDCCFHVSSASLYNSS